MNKTALKYIKAAHKQAMREPYVVDENFTKGATLTEICNRVYHSLNLGLNNIDQSELTNGETNLRGRITLLKDFAEQALQSIERDTAAALQYQNAKSRGLIDFVAQEIDEIIKYDSYTAGNLPA